MFTIWIGDESKAPRYNFDTWREKHPDWDYRVYGNETLYGRKWKNQGIVDQYLKEKRYPGVADVMRYELLLEHGGFCHPADAECLHNVEELLDPNYDAYAVYENEQVRPGLTSPLYACSAGNEFCKALVDNLPAVPPHAARGTPDRPSKAPWQVTGNAYMRTMIARMNYPKLLIWPSYRFIPIHHTGVRYEGNEKVYAVQQFGSTTEAGIGVRDYKWEAA